MKEIAECFRAELAKILGDKNSSMILSSILNELQKSPEDLTPEDVPLVWRYLEGNLMALLGVSGMRVIQSLIYRRLLSSGIKEVQKYWVVDLENN